MSKRRNNRSVHAPQDVVLVGYADSALKTGALNTTGTTVTLADGQLGVQSKDWEGTVKPGNMITAGVTSFQVKSISVVQGTPNSASLQNVNTFKVNDQAFVESGIIDADKVISVTTTTPEIGVFDTQHITGFTAPVVDTVYSLTVTIESAKRDMYFTLQKRDQNVNSQYSFSTAAASPTDDTLQNLAVAANLGSSIWAGGFRPFIVLGINTGAGAGQVINTITKSTVIPFMTSGGVTYNLNSSVELVNTLNIAVAAGLTGTATIENMNLATAGGAANVDALLVIGFDETDALAYDDWDIKKTRVQGHTNLTYTTRVKRAYAKDWVGNGDHWKRFWKNRAALLIGATDAYIGHPYQLTLDNIPEYITESAIYTSTIIEFRRNTETLTVNGEHPHRLIILLPAQIVNDALAVSAGLTTATNATEVTTLNSILGAWLSHASDSFSNVKYLAGASQATPFV